MEPEALPTRRREGTDRPAVTSRGRPGGTRRDGAQKGRGEPAEARRAGRQVHPEPPKGEPQDRVPRRDRSRGVAPRVGGGGPGRRRSDGRRLGGDSPRPTEPGAGGPRRRGDRMAGGPKPRNSGGPEPAAPERGPGAEGGSRCAGGQCAAVYLWSSARRPMPGPRTEPGTQRRGGGAGLPVALLHERSLAVWARASPVNRCGGVSIANTGPGKKNGPLPLAGGLKIAFILRPRNTERGLCQLCQVNTLRSIKNFCRQL